MIEAAAQLNIPYVTFFGFSTENWQRPAQEVMDLMGLLRHYLAHEVKAFHAQGAKLQVIGDRLGLDADLIKLIDAAEAKTKQNQNILLMLLILNYSQLKL